MQTRRFFLKTTLVGTALLSVACADNQTKSSEPLSALKILKVVQTDLFPQKAIEDSNAYRYLSVILQHSRVSQSDKDYLRNGTRWLNEEAEKEYDTSYIDLDEQKRQDVLNIIAEESWGRSWIKTVLTYIMEASLGDPIYGINKQESGWKWLSHEPGLPRPKEALL